MSAPVAVPPVLLARVNLVLAPDGRVSVEEGIGFSEDKQAWCAGEPSWYWRKDGRILASAVDLPPELAATALRLRRFLEQARAWGHRLLAAQVFSNPALDAGLEVRLSFSDIPGPATGSLLRIWNLWPPTAEARRPRRSAYAAAGWHDGGRRAHSMAEGLPCPEEFLALAASARGLRAGGLA